MSEVAADEDPARHWDEVYRNRGIRGVSWFQSEPQVSLELIEALGVSPAEAIIDVGGGASPLVERLVERGWRDMTVLDISDVALVASRERLPRDAPVTWLHQDLRAWRPTRSYGLWHDRAVFHFLVDSEDRETYFSVLGSAVKAGGSLILATFASGGPSHCSGLPVACYSSDDLASLLADHTFEVVEIRHEDHVSPSGAIQPFVWVAARATRSHESVVDIGI